MTALLIMRTLFASEFALSVMATLNPNSGNAAAKIMAMYKYRKSISRIGPTVRIYIPENTKIDNKGHTIEIDFE